MRSPRAPWHHGALLALMVWAAVMGRALAEVSSATLWIGGAGVGTAYSAMAVSSAPFQDKEVCFCMRVSLGA